DACDPNLIGHIYGMAAAYTMVDALKRAGKNPSRASLLRAATHLLETNNPFLQSGITIKTSPTDYAPVEQLRMLRYHNGRWSAFGNVAAVRSLALAAAKTPQLLVSGATSTGASAQTVVRLKGSTA